MPSRISEPLWLRQRWLFAAAVDAWIRDAKRQALEAAIKARADAEGITARIEATEAGIRSPLFYARFHSSLACTAPTDKADVNQIRGIALHVLKAMNVDTRDVHFTLFWAGPDGDPAEDLEPNVLRFSDCSVGPEARARILGELAREAAA